MLCTALWWAKEQQRIRQTVSALIDFIFDSVSNPNPYTFLDDFCEYSEKYIY